MTLTMALSANRPDFGMSHANASAGAMLTKKRYVEAISQAPSASVSLSNPTPTNTSVSTPAENQTTAARRMGLIATERTVLGASHSPGSSCLRRKR